MARAVTRQQRVLWCIIVAAIGSFLWISVMMGVQAPSAVQYTTRVPTLLARSTTPSQPALTVITSVLDADCQLLEETVRSIKSSTFPVAWVVVNDHSTQPLCDVTSEATLVMNNTGPRGLGPARQFVLDRLDAQYVGMLDGDDLLAPEAYEKAVWVLETQRRMSMVGWYLQEFGHTYSQWRAGFFELEGMYNVNRFVVTTVVRRDDAERCNARFRQDLRGGMEDWEYWLQMVDCGLTGHTIPTLDFYYRTRDPEIRKKQWPSLFARHEQVKKRIQALHESLRFQKNLPESGYSSPFNSPDMAAIVLTRPPRVFNYVLPQYVCGLDVVVALRLLTHAIVLPFSCLPLHSASQCAVLVLVETMALSPFHSLVLSMIQVLTSHRGCHVTVATSNHNPPGSSALEAQIRLAGAHVFVLPAFSALGDQVAFLGHVLKSRKVDHVLLMEQPLGLATIGHLRRLFDSPATFTAAVVNTSSVHTKGALPYLDGVVVPSQAHKTALQRGASGFNVSSIVVHHDWSEDTNSLLESLLSFPRRLRVPKPLSTLRASLATVSRPEAGVVDMLEYVQSDLYKQ